MPTGNVEFVQSSINAEPAGGETREQVQQGEWALRKGRTRPERGHGTWEGRGGGVSPADGAAGKGAPGTRCVRDDEGAHGDPGKDGPIYLSS